MKYLLVLILVSCQSSSSSHIFHFAASDVKSVLVTKCWLIDSEEKHELKFESEFNQPFLLGENDEIVDMTDDDKVVVESKILLNGRSQTSVCVGEVGELR